MGFNFQHFQLHRHHDGFWTGSRSDLKVTFKRKWVGETAGSGFRIAQSPKVAMCGCAGNDMQELQDSPQFSQTLSRWHRWIYYYGRFTIFLHQIRGPPCGTKPGCPIACSGSSSFSNLKSSSQKTFTTPRGENLTLKTMANISNI